MQASVSIPIFGRFNFTFGVNHSYGGATAIEFGVAPPGGLGIGYSPYGYSAPVTGGKNNDSFPWF
ncbi:polymorphic toxin type 22 domain-containing protein [Pseudacidovorax sp. NFM-22]|uniref:polymorphic toxin type 22 domain-containing protein n=1 Tax=Pseudacidovorax sp. NFM-22 TaxID=2744469 RepID=UPI00351D2D05